MLHFIKVIKQRRILSKEEWTAITDLRNDDSVIITKPDKGNRIVIVNKLDYLNKMKQLVSDETKFIKLALIVKNVQPRAELKNLRVHFGTRHFLPKLYIISKLLKVPLRRNFTFLFSPFFYPE